jgi:putative thioredoxin
MTDPASFRLSGAVDLGALRQPAPTPGSDSPYVIDVSEATFQADVVDKSREVPVVIDFWASWCGPCRQLSPILEKLAAEGNGSWILAKVDVDANQRISQAAGVQGIPAVKAVVDGAIVGEFTGALPEPQVRDWVQQLVALAEQQRAGVVAGEPGVEGAAAAEGAAAPGAVAPAPTPGERALDAAYDALARGDLDAAEAGLTEALRQAPNDANAKAGLAQIDIVRRAQGYDEQALQPAVAANPDDVDTNLAIADLEVLSGQLDEAFDRLIALVKRVHGDDRDRVRERLLSLFEAVDPADPAVLRARRELSSALF